MTFFLLQLSHLIKKTSLGEIHLLFNSLMVFGFIPFSWLFWNCYWWSWWYSFFLLLFLLFFFLFHFVNLLFLFKVTVVRSRSWSWIIIFVGLLWLLRIWSLRYILVWFSLSFVFISITRCYFWCFAWLVFPPKVLMSLLYIHLFRFITISVFTGVSVYCLFLFYDIIKDRQLGCLRKIENHFRLRRFCLV